MKVFPKTRSSGGGSVLGDEVFEIVSFEKSREAGSEHNRDELNNLKEEENVPCCLASLVCRAASRMVRVGNKRIEAIFCVGLSVCEFDVREKWWKGEKEEECVGNCVFHIVFFKAHIVFVVEKYTLQLDVTHTKESRNYQLPLPNFLSDLAETGAVA